MSEENILIPKSRYDKLVARMTQPFKNYRKIQEPVNKDQPNLYNGVADTVVQPEGNPRDHTAHQPARWIRPSPPDRLGHPAPSKQEEPLRR